MADVLSPFKKVLYICGKTVTHNDMKRKLKINEMGLVRNEDGLYVGITTRELLLRLLDVIGCQCVIESNMNIRFDYKGETFYAIAYNNSTTITIVAPWWEQCSLYDIDAVAMIKKAINEVNCTTYVTTYYEVDEEEDLLGISSDKAILLISRIPDLEQYLRSALDEFFVAHHRLTLDVERMKNGLK